MELQTLVEAAASFGWAGLIVALVIMLGVFIARKSGIVATGNHARLANIILGAVLYGLNGTADSETALHAVMASVLSALFYELLKYFGSNLAVAAR